MIQGEVAMEFDPSTVRPSVFYHHMTRSIVPRPIAWVSTCSQQGVPNVAPFSYFCGVGSRPPTVLFCPANARDGGPKDTLRNIQQTGDFVVNIVPSSAAEPMNQSAASVGPEVSEFELCGLTQRESVRVAAPGVAESPIQFECSLMQVIELGDGPGGANIVVGRVEYMRIDDSVLDESGEIQPDLLDAVGRMGGQEYCRTTERFELDRPG